MSSAPPPQPQLCIPRRKRGLLLCGRSLRGRILARVVAVHSAVVRVVGCCGRQPVRISWLGQEQLISPKERREAAVSRTNKASEGGGTHLWWRFLLALAGEILVGQCECPPAALCYYKAVSNPLKMMKSSFFLAGGPAHPKPQFWCKENGP